MDWKYGRGGAPKKGQDGFDGKIKRAEKDNNVYDVKMIIEADTVRRQGLSAANYLPEKGQPLKAADAFDYFGMLCMDKFVSANRSIAANVAYT